MEQNQQPLPPVFNQPQQAPQQPAPQYQPRVTATPMMDPVTAVKTCFKKYFDFKGRARRSEFWWFVLFVIIVSSALTFLSALVPAIGYLGLAFSLAVIIPQFAALVRRLHDTNHGGWWALLMLLCFLGYYGCLAYLLGPNIENLTNITDPMEMGMQMVDSIQASPGVATAMMVCSFGAIILAIVNIIFAVFDSKWNTNKYGPSPKYK
jgi:uncharacterized membrane protein YhaH (DUF805 family)